MKIYVNVTKDDVRLGMVSKTTPSECPIGRAVNRALKRNGIKETAMINWGGSIWIGNTSVSPEGLKRMPMCYSWERKHDRFISRPRKFSFEYKG